mgnify:CR=1 FL=1
MACLSEQRMTVAHTALILYWSKAIHAIGPAVFHPFRSLDFDYISSLDIKLSCFSFVIIAMPPDGRTK